MTEPSDELIERCRHGSAAAFAEVMACYERPLFAFVYRMFAGCSRLDPEDIVQEVFLKAYRHISGFNHRQSGSFTAWLFGIARNHCIGVLRKSKVENRFRADETSRLDQARDGKTHDPTDAVSRDETVASIMQAIQGLPEAIRSAFLLRFYHDVDYEQIARILDCTENAARSRVCRAKRILSDRLNRPVASRGD